MESSLDRAESLIKTRYRRSDTKRVNLLRSMIDLPLIQGITVEGPVSVSEYKSRDLNKHIYIFGDDHEMNKVCSNGSSRTITLQKFIDSTIRDNYDKIIDIYIESPYRIADKEEKVYNDNYLTRLENYFSNCLDLDKSKCQYINARFHYVDIRNRGTNELILDSAMFLLDYINIPDFTNVIPYIKSLSEKLLEILKYTPTEQIFHESKTQKQFNSIKNSRLRVNVTKYFHEKWNKQVIEVINHLEKVIEYSDKYIPRSDLDQIHKNRSSDLDQIHKNKNQDNITYNIYRQQLAELIANLIALGTIIMDAYLAGRILRSFDDGPSPKYIIVYVGDIHKTHLEQLLTYLNFDYIGENTSNIKYRDYQCLSIGLKLPFFT